LFDFAEIWNVGAFWVCEDTRIEIHLPWNPRWCIHPTFYMFESLLQPRIVWFRFTFVLSSITWHPMYYKRSTSRGQRSGSQSDIVTANKSLVTQSRIVRFGLNLVDSLTTWHLMYCRCSMSGGQRSRYQREDVVWLPNYCSFVKNTESFLLPNMRVASVSGSGKSGCMS